MMVSLVPSTKAVEDTMNALMDTLRKIIREKICEIGGAPREDVFVNLCCCPYRNPDPDLAEVILYGETSPDEKLEVSADKLCSEVATVLSDFGFTQKGAENWIRFIPGSWCLIRGGEIVSSTFEDTNQPTD